MITQNLLRINVGYIAHENVGYSREFLIEVPEIFIAPDLELREFLASIEIARTAHGLLVTANLHALIRATCVRCLEEFSQPLETSFTELYAFSSNSITDSGLLLPETGWIDLSPIVRDEMLVAFPINPLCSPDCLGLCPVCGENRNFTVCNHEDEQIDPRFAALKALLTSYEEPSDIPDSDQPSNPDMLLDKMPPDF